MSWNGRCGRAASAPACCCAPPTASTFTYTKLLNGQTGEEDRPRVDFINARPPEPAWDLELVAGLETAAPAYDAILVSDQAETAQGGVVTSAMREAVRRVAAANPRTLVWVDSRVRAEHFRGVIVKPNREEAETASLRALGRVDFAALRRHMEAPLLVVTHGAGGAELVDERGSRWAPARRIAHPVDICGAGDSFSAGAALALRVTGDAPAAARIRQPGGLHHHHEEGHGDGIAGGGVGSMLKSICFPLCPPVLPHRTDARNAPPPRAPRPAPTA